MATSGFYFVSKFDWQEGQVNDYNKIILMVRPQEFNNRDYLELSKVFNKYTQWQLFKATQKIFLSTPDHGKDEGRFKKFKRNIGEFQDDFSRNRCQQNFDLDFLDNPYIYFLIVFAIETQNEDAPADVTTETSPHLCHKRICQVKT